MPEFKVESPFEPTGDQPEAIAQLVKGLREGYKKQTLLGVTGSGKTYTVAKIVEQVQRPTLVLAPNKTLAAQLYSEFKEFFPNNAVEYFVSYYDYYQPEAYIARTDTYVEKESMLNEEIEKLRLVVKHAGAGIECDRRLILHPHLRAQRVQIDLVRRRDVLHGRLRPKLVGAFVGREP